MALTLFISMQNLSLPNTQPSAPNASFERRIAHAGLSTLLRLANGQSAPQLKTHYAVNLSVFTGSV
jgi:hypothetical protein